MVPYEFVTPDQLIAYGSVAIELFENAAYGIASRFSMEHPRLANHDVPIAAIGDTYEELLSDWLAQLGEASAAGMMFVSFTVDALEVGGVRGAAAGYRMQANWPETTVETVVTVPDGLWARILLRSD